MNYWKPKQVDGGMPTGGSLASSISAPMPPELPSVGDKILLRVGYHGYVEAVNPEFVTGGQQLVEVEVTSIKKVNVAIE
jgi:hypothetical protein